MNIPELMRSVMADWKERAEKAEAELVKAAALINTARDEAAISSVTCGQMRKELGRVKAQCAEMREALRCVESIVANWALDCGPNSQGDRDYQKLEHALSSSAGTGYVRADDMTPALEGALVICRCFADGQEASPGFMDNNENVLRIKDALAKAKRFLA